MFDGFPREGLQFLGKLAKNNNRDWFHANKSMYDEQVKVPMEAFVGAINAELKAFAPSYVAAGKKAISRINRDTRFSKDKSPYRTDISAVFTCHGKEKHEAAGFYVSISPKHVDIVGGVYMPGPEQLAKIRSRLDKKHAELSKVIGGKALRDAMGELKGEQLQRIPKGFPPEHEAGDLLRQKQFYFRVEIDNQTVTSPRIVQEIADRFRAMAPFVSWLDSALGNVPRA